MSDKKKQYKKFEKETSFMRSGSSTGITIKEKERPNTGRAEFFRILERVTRPLSSDQEKKGT